MCLRCCLTFSLALPHPYFPKVSGRRSRTAISLRRPMVLARLLTISRFILGLQCYSALRPDPNDTFTKSNGGSILAKGRSGLPFEGPQSHQSNPPRSSRTLGRQQTVLWLEHFPNAVNRVFEFLVGGGRTGNRRFWATSRPNLAPGAWERPPPRDLNPAPCGPRAARGPHDQF